MKIFSFLIAVYFINFLSAIKLTIREADSNKKYFIESSSLLTLTCESDSISQNENIQWFLPSNPSTPVSITDSTQKVSYKIEKVGNKNLVILTIRDVSNEYSGRYFCKCYQYEGNSQTVLASADVSISLFKPVTPINCNSEQWIMINSIGTLKCEFYSEPRAIVSWEFKGELLSQSTKYKISDWGLDIYNVQPSDSGQYVVTAKTITHSSSVIKDIIVTAFELPKIISGPTILAPITDGVVEDWYSDIQCLATGNPMPTVHWFRKKDGNNELQKVNSQKFFVNTNPKVGILRISRPEYPDENDEYTCQAMLATDKIDNVNFPKDIVSRSIIINVSVRPQFTQIEQMNTVVDPGTTAYIRCRVRTTEPVSLIWQRYLGEAYTMGVQKSDPRISVSVEKEPLDPLFQVLRLEIRNVQFSDSWNYTCIATNPGSNYSYNGTIVVRQKPMLTNNTPTIESGWLFNATNLTCISYGLPQPTNWFWYRSGFSVLNDVNSTFRIISYDYETHSQSWLQIIPDLSTQYWIFDFFECQALNEVGRDRKTIKFTSARIPGSPKALYVGTSPSSLTFQIEPPARDGGMKLLHFEMIYRAIQGPTTLYGPVFYQPDQTIVVMDGLMHDTSYQVSFYSCNAVGRSPDTTLFARTLSATTPFPVKVISPKFSGYPYGYNLEWTVPLNGGFPILGYRVVLWRVSSSPTYQGNKTFSYLVEHPELLVDMDNAKVYEMALSNPYQSMFRLDDLEAASLYRVSVAARNTIGYSNSTTTLFWTPEGDALGKPPRVRGAQDCRAKPRLEWILLLIIMVACL